MVVIELAGAKRFHKFAESVVAQFVDILVTTRPQRRESYRPEQGYDAGRQIKARRPQFYAERSLRNNDFPLLQDHERRNQQRCNAQTDQQRHHRVRFKDVSDDLIRVNQVVDSYKIIAYPKFSPKEISRNGIDEQGRDKDEHGQEKDHLTIHRPNAGKGPTKAETHSLIEGQVSQNARQTLIKFRQTFIEERQIEEDDQEQSAQDVIERPAMFAFGDKEVVEENTESPQQAHAGVSQSAAHKGQNEGAKRQTANRLRIEDQNQAEDESGQDRESDHADQRAEKVDIRLTCLHTEK
ncbi:hypothetical protein GCWU000325_02225 [Alloprevotella tannerae ATCC 51259]|uniref:Uncharacterized protein n=1 Tax=Alloprevotella tannerae ATCC 51259 TaxID=626522 RepID=C9LJ13_9BACT|nr:hypothetical protein GCWU000325_02225 [Alloprevotella tannerae ATCC 51259]